eukprot:UN08384
MHKDVIVVCIVQNDFFYYKHSICNQLERIHHYGLCLYLFHLFHFFCFFGKDCQIFHQFCLCHHTEFLHICTT